MALRRFNVHVEADVAGVRLLFLPLSFQCCCLTSLSQSFASLMLDSIIPLSSSLFFMVFMLTSCFQPLLMMHFAHVVSVVLMLSLSSLYTVQPSPFLTFCCQLHCRNIVVMLIHAHSGIELRVFLSHLKSTPLAEMRHQAHC